MCFPIAYFRITWQNPKWKKAAQLRKFCRQPAESIRETESGSLADTEKAADRPDSRRMQAKESEEK